MQVQDDYFEHTFGNVKEAMEHLESWQLRVMGILLSKLEAGTDGLKVGGDLMQTGKTAFGGLLTALRIPEPYAAKVCDEDLLSHTINHLARKSGERVRVIAENNMVRHILPWSCDPIDHRLVLEQLGEAGNGDASIAISPEVMRVSFLKGDLKKIGNGEEVGFGYDVMNSSTCGRLTVSPYALVLVCRNGAVSKTPLAEYKYGSGKDAPLSVILHKFKGILSACQDFSKLHEGLKASLNEVLGNDAPLADRHLLKMFGKRLFDTSLRGKLSNQSTAFELVNAITSATKVGSLLHRRRWESQAGDILEVLSTGEGRRREGLNRLLRCRRCPVLN